MHFKTNILFIYLQENTYRTERNNSDMQSVMNIDVTRLSPEEGMTNNINRRQENSRRGEGMEKKERQDGKGEAGKRKKIMDDNEEGDEKERKRQIWIKKDYTNLDVRRPEKEEENQVREEEETQK